MVAGVIFGGGPGSAYSEVGVARVSACLLYTSDAADERSSVDLGGRRIIKKKKVMKDISDRRTTEDSEEQIMYTAEDKK